MPNLCLNARGIVNCRSVVLGVQLLPFFVYIDTAFKVIFNSSGIHTILEELHVDSTAVMSACLGIVLHHAYSAILLI